MTHELKPKRILIFFIALTVLLAIAHMVSYHYAYFVDRKYHHFYEWFNMGSEDSIPSLIILFQWVIIVVLLSTIALIKISKKESYIFWIFLTLVFLFLTFDEGLSIHEKLINTSASWTSTKNLLYLAWIIPYTVGTFIFVLISAWFLIKLNRRTRYLFIFSGIVFLIGAIGFELVENHYYYGFLTKRFIKRVAFQLSVMFGEAFEMFGLSIFIYSLIDFIKIKSGGVVNLKIT